jgi:hypothetical protein
MTVVQRGGFTRLPTTAWGGQQGNSAHAEVELTFQSFSTRMMFSRQVPQWLRA